MDLGTKNRFEVWALPHSPTKVIGDQSKYWETMATTNAKKDAQKKGENIEINRSESPFKVIKFMNMKFMLKGVRGKPKTMQVLIGVTMR